MNERVITRIWINTGCIACSACEAAVPAVFAMTDDSCRIRDGAHRHFMTERDAIIKAAEECPAKAIRIMGYNERVEMF